MSVIPSTPTGKYAILHKKNIKKVNTVVRKPEVRELEAGLNKYINLEKLIFPNTAASTWIGHMDKRHRVGMSLFWVTDHLSFLHSLEKRRMFYHTFATEN